MNTDAIEFENVKEARDNLLVKVKEDPNWTNWFRGAGMGFTPNNRWQLHINVKDDKDVANVEMMIRSIGYTGPFEITAIGDVAAL